MEAKSSAARPVGAPRNGQLGRQGTDRRAADAGIDQLAGLEPLGVAPPPGGDGPPEHRDQVRRGRADIDQERRFLGQQPRGEHRQGQPVGRGDQRGILPGFRQLMELAVQAPDHDRLDGQGIDRRRRGSR